jgi:hypothetical protein
MIFDRVLQKIGPEDLQANQPANFWSDCSARCLDYMSMPAKAMSDSAQSSRMSDIDLEKSAQAVGEAIRTNPDLGPEHPSHKIFAQAFQVNRLGELIDKTNTYMETHDIRFVSLAVKNAPHKDNASGQSVCLIHNHNDAVLSQDDFYKADTGK